MSATDTPAFSAAGSAPEGPPPADDLGGRGPQRAPHPAENARGESREVVPFTRLEDAIVHSERTWPITMQVEAHLRGRLDAERLRASIAAAMADHPLARVARSPARALARTQHWIDRTGADPRRLATLAAETLAVVDLGSDDELDDGRDRWLSAAIPLGRAPLWRVVLAHLPDRDVLLLSVHHGMCDGIGAVALLRDVLAHYGAGPTVAPTAIGDPHAEIDRRAAPAGPSRRAPDREHESGDAHGPGAAAPAPARAARRPFEAFGAIDAVVRSPRATRLAGGGGQVDRPGYHVALDHLDATETDALRRGRHAVAVPTATLNDLLLTALHRTLAGWNVDHGTVAGLVSVTVPVTGRTPAERDRVVANLTLQATTTSTAGQRADRTGLLRHLRDQTAAIKRDGAAHEPAASLGAVAFLPAELRSRVPAIVSRLTRDRFVDTSRLSNLGRHGPIGGDRWPDGSPAGGCPEVEHLWFSPPVRMPQGLTVGVVVYDGALHLAARACRAAWDRPAVQAFVAQLHHELLALG